MRNEVYGSFLIPADRVDELQSAVDKLSRRIKSGKTFAEFPPAIEGIRNHYIEREGVVTPYAWVTLRYQQPSVNGWFLIAVYDWEVTPDGQRICYTSPVPGQQILSEFREVEDGRCDHCHVNRQRSKSMLITKDFTDYMVVGTSCIKDFLGHASAKSFIDMFSFHKLVGEFSSSDFKGTPVAYLKSMDIVDTASMIVRKYGFVKSAGSDYSTGKLSTAEHVRDYLCGQSIEASTFRAENPITYSDREFAENACQYIREQNIVTSDYIENVVKALDAEYVTEKRIALLASVAGVYKRHIESQNSLKHCTNEHMGKVKDRLKGLITTVSRVRYTDGYYGTTTIITMHDSDGRTLVWFASGYHDVNDGEELIIDGTVKTHDEYKGIRQTVITRVKYKSLKQAA